MPERTADALVLAFSEGVSLKVWADTGLLDREWELYRRIANRFGRIDPLGSRLQFAEQRFQLGERYGTRERREMGRGRKNPAFRNRAHRGQVTK